MAPFVSLFLVLAAVLTIVDTVKAAPSPHRSFYHSTHRTRQIGKRGLIFSSYHPKTTFETFGAGIEHSLTKRANATLKESAMAFAQQKIGSSSDELAWKSGFSHSNGEFAYLRQSYDGIPFANSVINVAFKDKKAVGFGSSFIKPTKVAPKTPSISLESAISTAEKELEAKFANNTTPTLEYYAKEDKSVVLTHVIQVSDEASFKFYEAYVNAHSGVIESVIDFVNDATYRAVPISRQSIVDGAEDIVDPEDLSSSPSGWVTDDATRGNNIISSVGSFDNNTSETAPGQFLYDADPEAEPGDFPNVDAARVNAFYVVNTLHDIMYRYGFREDSFNFQSNNFGKGGAGGDTVFVSIQDTLSTNNAQFVTFPEGQPGLMRMFVWTFTSPRRDGALSNDVVTHEMTHGLTTRLTGGGTARCLQSLESGGLGEGWSDAFAEWTEQVSANTEDFTLGKYVTDSPAGIRRFPYSVNPKTNPLRYSDAATTEIVHEIGQVWANMLHNIYATLVDKYGFNPNAFTDVDGLEGNVVFVHLFVDALSIQPCNPTFVTARDAFIQADINRYDGMHECDIWRQFASRGLGINADDFVDDETLPRKCRATPSSPVPTNTPTSSSSVTGLPISLSSGSATPGSSVELAAANVGSFIKGLLEKLFGQNQNTN